MVKNQSIWKGKWKKNPSTYNTYILSGIFQQKCKCTHKFILSYVRCKIYLSLASVLHILCIFYIGLHVYVDIVSIKIHIYLQIIYIYIYIWYISLGISPGGGHGNPLWYSCLENPMDRGARRSAVHGVGNSRTVLAVEHANMSELPPRSPASWQWEVTFWLLLIGLGVN